MAERSRPQALLGSHSPRPIQNITIQVLHVFAQPMSELFLEEHGEESEVSVSQMAQTVWLVAVGLCHDRFSQDALNQGPPGIE